MPGAYYNEIDPFAADWLRGLMGAGLIAPGDVDERSIREVTSDDVRGYTQCHFFAGIGGWSRALRLAGWPDDRPVWTGSCPCQPFSVSGKRSSFADDRHLWPEWFRLIGKCHPQHVLGEQVASQDGLVWLDLVWADLEAEGYAVGAADLCAAGVGAPHIRQRLWFVGDSVRERWREGRPEERQHAARGPGIPFGMADTHGGDAGQEREQRGGEQRQQPQDGGPGERVAHATRERIDRGRDSGQGRGGEPADGRLMGDAPGQGPFPGAFPGIHRGEEGPGARDGEPERPGATFWEPAEWIACTDGKARPVEPGTFPLAHGVPGRVGRLRGYGNAIVPQVAAEFITAFLEAT